MCYVSWILYMHDTGILTDTGDCTEHFPIPLTSHLNFFCSKNLRARRKNCGDHFFWILVLTILTTRFLPSLWEQQAFWKPLVHRSNCLRTDLKPEGVGGWKEGVQRCKTLCVTFPGVIGHAVKQSVTQSCILSWMNLKSGKYKLLKSTAEFNILEIRNLHLLMKMYECSGKV